MCLVRACSDCESLPYLPMLKERVGGGGEGGLLDRFGVDSKIALGTIAVMMRGGQD